ncbi:hypothetical protein PT277_00265 [Acetobacteraceae bacterium ESL0709]|nr:hypothetical protein [Acetobacteraceae bacterium ESL0709]
MKYPLIRRALEGSALLKSFGSQARGGIWRTVHAVLNITLV